MRRLALWLLPILFSGLLSGCATTYVEEKEPVLVKDGEWLCVGVRHGCVFFTDGDSIEITNDLEWRLINFK